MITYYRLQDTFDVEDLAVISTCRYKVIKETPKGVWIIPHWQHEVLDGSLPKGAKFILHGAKKRYAYPTWEEARLAYIKRKRSQITHASRAHDYAKERLKIAQHLTEQSTVHGQRDLLDDN